jgi:hypothetical protein
MFKILLIVLSLSGAGAGHITTQVIGSYTDVNVCTTIASQLSKVHNLPGSSDYSDFEVSAKCFQSTDR